jgi:hypothetical protein
MYFLVFAQVFAHVFALFVPGLRSPLSKILTRHTPNSIRITEILIRYNTQLTHKQRIQIGVDISSLVRRDREIPIHRDTNAIQAYKFGDAV